MTGRFQLFASNLLPHLEQVTLILEGRTNFTLGTKYRIYTQKQRETLQTVKLPQVLLPGRSLLGYEKVGENGSQKMM